ncbi:hypothetical protein HMPREF0908_1763 [Selenomonas flueggei ATCC 43531]|uniref:Uncharacterized protein n=1 Tax=Selenomonas flueggei ATCC 43531 TaxID=638302 RepID=C4V5G9_9FIRM|nr:hypothetical protein HMPREF0908_1763 [Selenomonas flueggei ATCC 43531]
MFMPMVWRMTNHSGARLLHTVLELRLLRDHESKEVCQSEVLK